VAEQADRYLQHTGDSAAAASLTLADVMQSKANQGNIPQTDPHSLTVREAAERLHLSSKTIYQMCISGKMRSFRVGRPVRIPVEEIHRFEANTPPAPASPALLTRDHLS